MNTLTIVLIILTIVLLISNIVLFVVERRKYTFDKTKAKVIILVSTDRLEIEKEDADIIKKYNVLDMASGDLKTQHETIYIKSYLAEKR